MMIRLEVSMVSPMHGWLWISHGFRLIRRSPLHAVSLAMVMVASLMLALMIPLAGLPLALLILPVMQAGYMRICKFLEYSEPVQPQMIFAGFSERTVQLVSLGGFFMLGMMLISMVVALMGGDAMVAILEAFQQNRDAEQMVNAMFAPESGLRVAIFAGFALFFILMLAMQFSPMLVYFNQVPPLQAMRISLVASVKNILAFTLYSLLMQLIMLVLGFVPLGFGVLMWAILALASMYVAYRDIFNEIKSE